MTGQAGSVRWGILGTARIAEKVVAGIHAADHARAAVIGSRDAARAAAWAAEHQVAESTGSYQAVLDHPDVEAVYIPLPNNLHREWTIRAAECGKHVLCEKPLGLDTAQATEMAAACREHGVQLMDGVMWVHHPRFASMHDTLTNGSLGRLRRVTSAFSFCFDEVPEDDIRLSRETGGGSLLDLGWYCARVTWWAFGGLPERVFATARYHRDVDMNLSAMLWYDDERMASFDCGFDIELRKWFEVAGSDASLVCDDFLSPWDESRPRHWIHNRAGLVSEERTAPDVDQVAMMIGRFSEIVRTGELDQQLTDDAIATQRICEAVERSARSEEIVELGM